MGEFISVHDNRTLIDSKLPIMGEFCNWRLDDLIVLILLREDKVYTLLNLDKNWVSKISTDLEKGNLFLHYYHETQCILNTKILFKGILAIVKYNHMRKILHVYKKSCIPIRKISQLWYSIYRKWILITYEKVQNNPEGQIVKKLKRIPIKKQL